MPIPVSSILDFQNFRHLNWVSESWATAGRPVGPLVGRRGYNTTLNSEEYWNGTLWFPVNPALAPNASIPLSALTVDPLARANHTGTQTASTISDFVSAVRLNTLNQMAAPTAAVGMNGQKITGMAQGTAAGEAIEFSQLATAINTAVDSARRSIDIKDPVRAIVSSTQATTGIPSLANSDNVALVAGDRVLKLNQIGTPLADARIWVVAAGAWTLPVDADNTAGALRDGTLVVVGEGTTYADKQVTLRTNGTIIGGTTPLDWTVAAAGGGVSSSGSGALVVAGSVITFTPDPAGDIDVTAAGARIKPGSTLARGITQALTNGVAAVSPGTGTVSLAYSAGVQAAFTFTHNLGRRPLDTAVYVKTALSNGVVANTLLPFVGVVATSTTMTITFDGAFGDLAGIGTGTPGTSVEVVYG